MNILVSSAGRRVSLVRAFKKELNALFPGGRVYGTDLQPQFSAACQVTDGAFAVRRISEAGAIEELIEICCKHEISLIIPTIDTELLALARNFHLFEKKGIQIVISKLDFVAKCRDKRQTNELFQDLGVELPKIYDRDANVYPMFAKPYDGSLSKDIHLIHSAGDITDEMRANEKLMYMEYLSPSEYSEYTVDMYYDVNHKLCCAVPRKRIEVRAGEVNKALAQKNELYHFLIEKMAVIPGARGCLTVQFFMNNDANRFVGIEINPRFGGGYPLSYAAGANYPGYVLAEYLLKKEIPFFDSWQNNLLMLRYDDEIVISM